MHFIDRESSRRVRRAAAALGALAALCLIAPAAQAQTYPAKPVRIVVPFTPGGSTDILARALGQALSEAWKQQVIVENKPGAGGIIGAEAVARAAPDGYTLLMGHIGTLAVNPTLYPKLPYDAITDFAPVALVAMVPNVLVVHPSVPARTVNELIALAKAKPGALSYSTGGTGSAAHLATEYFKLATGTDILHVPYKGAAPAVTDLIGGQVSMTLTGLPPLLQHVRAGKLRALGVASATRLPQIPEVPTIAESGVSGFEATQWYGVVAPARTPPALVDRIAADIRKALERPDLKQRLEAEGAQPTSLGPAEFGAFIRKEIERWAKVIRAANIQPN
jgi:tripartite-type tricarboxylate transporter receptor subunit TctC